MFEFLPAWLKALIGGGLMLFIGIAGFSLTSKGDSKSTSTKGSNNSTEK